MEHLQHTHTTVATFLPVISDSCHLQGQKFGCNHEVTQASTTTLDKISKKSYYTAWEVRSALQKSIDFFTFSILSITIQLLIIQANNCTHHSQQCATPDLNYCKCITCNHHYFRKETMPNLWITKIHGSVSSLINFETPLVE